MKEVVFDPPGIIFGPRVNDNAISPQIGQVSVGLITFVWSYIDNLMKK